MTPKDFYSVTEVAKVLGISGERIRKKIQEKKMSATKIGGYWIISREDLSKYLERCSK